MGVRLRAVGKDYALFARKVHLKGDDAGEPFVAACGHHAKKEYQTVDATKVTCTLCKKHLELEAGLQPGPVTAE